MTASIICLGDSITYGYPVGPDFSWVEHLQQRTKINLLNFGVNGSTSQDMLSRYRRYSQAANVAHVHILGGGNDALQQLTWGETRRNMQNLLELIRQRDTTPILGLLTPICHDPGGGGEFVPAPALAFLAKWKVRYRDWLRDYASRESILLIDYFTPFCLPGTDEGDGQYFYDESHLNENGQALLADVAEYTWLKTLSTSVPV